MKLSPPIELLYLRKVNIQANDRHSFAAKLEAQGEPNVSEANNCCRISHDQFFSSRTSKLRVRDPKLCYGR